MTTKPFRGDNDKTYCPVLTTPVEFTPQQVIYRELIPNDDDPNRSRYRDIFVPRRFYKQRFPDLLRQTALFGYSSNTYDPPEKCILDVPVYKRSVLLFQLPRGSKYSFRKHPIVLETEAEYCRNDLYGGLTFVDGNGNCHSDHIPDCQLVFFYAALMRGFKTSPYRQAFNFDVHPLQRTRLTYIDPDIRHPGIGGQNPEEDGG